MPGPRTAEDDVERVPNRRNAELFLLVLALGIGIFAYVEVGLAHDGKVPADVVKYVIGFGATAFIAHMFVRKYAPYSDPLLLPLATFVNGLGLVLIHRLDLHAQDVAAANHEKAPNAAVDNQLMWTAVGVALCLAVLVFIRDHKVLQRYAYLSMVAGLFLIALPAVLPASISEVNGARSWIRLAGFSIQPAEFGKLLIVSFFAAYLVQKKDALALASRRVLGLYLPRGRDLGPILVCWLLSLLILVRETDLGVSLMFFGAFVIMLYIATERASWLVFGLLMFVVGAAATAQLFHHVQSRVTAWLHPFSDVNGNTRQIAQSLYGFAAGGLQGTGLGQGHPYLVGFASNADFILVTVGEELGLIGLTALFVVYALIVVRGLKTSLLVRDAYGKMLASGLSVVFALQVFITAGGVMKLIPLTGLPMPFLAYGGSALVANWALVGMLLRISDAARRPLPPARPLPDIETTQVVRPA